LNQLLEVGRSCIQCFIEHRYAAAADLALVTAQDGWSESFLLIYLVCLRRTQREAAARDIAREFAERMTEQYGAIRLLRLACGTLSLDEVLPFTASPIERSRALFYGGLCLWDEGKRNAAVDALRTAVHTRADCLETMLAESELEHIESDIPEPEHPSPETDIEHLNDRIGKALNLVAANQAVEEIGRASCRERV